MERKIDPFLYGKRYLDLHGETQEISKILVKEFINDSIKLRENEIYIIHGKGLGLVKKSVYEELKSNKNVESYKLYMFNEGVTIVKLKL